MKHKKLFTLLLTVSLISVLTCGIFAEAINISNEVSYTRKYFTDNGIESDSFIMNMAYYATGVNYYIDFSPVITGKDTADGLSVDILTAVAAGNKDEKLTANTASLAALQNEDGSFGDVESTSLAIIAMKTAATVFDSEKAVESLIAKQQENGSFSQSETLQDNVEATSQALIALSPFKGDSNVQTAITSGVNYLYSTRNEDGTFGDGTVSTLSFVITALVDSGEIVNNEVWNLPALLLSFKNDDYSYKDTADGKTSVKATAYALLALDAVGSGESVFAELMSDGGIERFDIMDYLPMIIGYGALALCSVAFWIYIMFIRKKNTKTLKEVKEEW